MLPAILATCFAVCSCGKFDILMPVPMESSIHNTIGSIVAFEDAYVEKLLAYNYAAKTWPGGALDGTVLQAFPLEPPSTSIKDGDPYAKQYEYIRKITQDVQDYGVVLDVPDFVDCGLLSRILRLENRLFFARNCPNLELGSVESETAAIDTGFTQWPVLRPAAMLLASLNYTTVTVVQPADARTEKLTSQILALEGVEIGMNLKYKPGKTDFPEIIQKTYLKTRVYLLATSTEEDHVEFLVAMNRMGLMSTGEYAVFIAANFGSVEFANMVLKLDKKIPEDHTSSVFWRNVVLIGPTSPTEAQIDSTLAYGREDVPGGAMATAFFEGAPEDVRGKYAVSSESIAWFEAVSAYTQAIISAGDKNGADNVSTNAEDIVVNMLDQRLWALPDGVDGFQDTVFSVSRSGGIQPSMSVYTVKGNGTVTPLNTFRPPYDKVTADGLDFDWLAGLPRLEPICGFVGQLCKQKESDTTRYLFYGLAAFAALIVVLILVFAIRYIMIRNEIYRLAWQVSKDDVILMKTTDRSMSRASVGSMSLMSLGSTASLNYQALRDFEKGAIKQAKEKHKEKKKRNKLGEDERDQWEEFEDFAVATHKDAVVGVKRVYKENQTITDACLEEVRDVMKLNHENLNPLKGILYEPPLIGLVTSYCSRHNLQEVIEDDAIKLDDVFHASIIFDIIKGMTFLHKSRIGMHGRLKSTNCLVDAKWQVKLSDYGMWKWREQEQKPKTYEEQCRSLLWTAPEILQLQMERNPANALQGIWHASQQGDIYSFGIILHEIYGQSGVFGIEYLDPREIVTQLLDNETTILPDMDLVKAAPEVVKRTITSCLSADLEERLPFATLNKILQPIRAGMKSNILDNMIAMMEKYTQNLEGIVKERTTLLHAEKKKSERLLLQMLPESVTNLLKRGQPVPAEKFESVTVYFSDVVGFTQLAAESSPFEIVKFLNDLYTCFDSIIPNYDVYKVETIGDAYMVVSGLPERNGPHHVGEIASMSLNLLEAVKTFKIRHRPEMQVNLRIGMHTGPCVTGVVGLRMPRYCLFGDTVNMASRMESNGEALKIHCSESCKQALEKIGGYNMAHRGVMEIKGKGQQSTYWVIGEQPGARLERIKRDGAKYSGLYKKLEVQNEKE